MKGKLTAIFVIICIIILLSALYFNLLSSKKINLHELPPAQAVEIISAVHKNLTKYVIMTNYHAIMHMSFFGLVLNVDMNSTFDTHVDKSIQESSTEGDIYITTSFVKSNISLDNEEYFSLKDTDYYPASNRSHFKISVMGDVQTINIDGKIEEKNTSEDTFIWQDPIILVQSALINSSFIFLEDELLDGDDYYVISLNFSNLSVNESMPLVSFVNSPSNEMENSSDLLISPPTKPGVIDMYLWVNKENLLVKRILMKMNITEKEQMITFQMDSKIKYLE